MAKGLTRIPYLAEQGRLDFEGFRLTPIGLVAHGRPTFEAWQRCGVFLRGVEGAVPFWLGDWINYGEITYAGKYDEALETIGLEYQTLRNYAYVARQIEMSRRRDNLTFSIHAEVAPLEREQQEHWLNRAAGEGLKRADLRDALRLERRREVYAAGAMPAGRFRVVYADPPWHYDSSYVIGPDDHYGRAEKHYPTLTVDELCAVPVRDHITEDAVLWLWVTSPKLEQAFPVIAAWGFEYKTSMVWDKVAHNYGSYVSVRHEFLLICARGSGTPDHPTPMPDSVIVIPRSDVHSEKPDAVRALIDRLYDGGAESKLELFARAPREGWATWGNQVTDEGNLATTATIPMVSRASS